MPDRAFRSRFAIILTFAATICSLTTHPLTGADALTQHYNNARTGAVLDETTLTTRNVNSGGFRQALDAVRRRAGRGPATVRVGVAGEHGGQSRHAARAGDVQCRHRRHDAQHRLCVRRRQGESGRRRAHGAALGEVARSSAPRGQGHRHVEHERSGVGIVATPVVSPDRRTLFVVAWHSDGAPGLRYMLHALDLQKGTHRMPPVIDWRAGEQHASKSVHRTERVQSVCAEAAVRHSCWQTACCTWASAGTAIAARSSPSTHKRWPSARSGAQPRRERWRHLAVGSRALSRCAGERLPDDRQRDV